MLTWRKSAKGNMWASVDGKLVVVFSSTQAGPIRYYYSIDNVMQVGEFTSQPQAVAAAEKVFK